MGEQPALLRLPERPLEGIRLVACDMDGTALNENKEFSAATLAAFDALQRRGVRVTIVSARTPFMLGVFCRQAGIGDTPVIAWTARRSSPTRSSRFTAARWRPRRRRGYAINATAAAWTTRYIQPKTVI